MKLNKLVDSRDKLVIASNIKDCESGKVVYDIVSKELFDARDKYEDLVSIDELNVKKHFLYLSGYINALKFVLNIPTEALRIIKSSEGL